MYNIRNLFIINGNKILNHKKITNHNMMSILRVTMYFFFIRIKII